MWALMSGYKAEFELRWKSYWVKSDEIDWQVSQITNQKDKACNKDPLQHLQYLVTAEVTDTTNIYSHYLLYLDFILIYYLFTVSLIIVVPMFDQFLQPQNKKLYICIV